MFRIKLCINTYQENLLSIDIYKQYLPDQVLLIIVEAQQL